MNIRRIRNAQKMCTDFKQRLKGTRTDHGRKQNGTSRSVERNGNVKFLAHRTSPSLLRSLSLPLSLPPSLPSLPLSLPPSLPPSLSPSLPLSLPPSSPSLPHPGSPLATPMCSNTSSGVALPPDLAVPSQLSGRRCL